MSVDNDTAWIKNTFHLIYEKLDGLDIFENIRYSSLVWWNILNYNLVKRL